MINRKKAINMKDFSDSSPIVTAKLDKFRGKPYEFEFLARNAVRRKAILVMNELNFMPGKHAKALKNLIQSGLSNAHHNNNLDVNSLYIRSIVASRGRYLKRVEFKGRGRTGQIWRPSGYVLLELQGANVG